MGGYREFSADEHSTSNLFHSVTAIVIWLGSVHLNVAIVLSSLIFLPPSLSLLYIHIFSLSLSSLHDTKFKNSFCNPLFFFCRVLGLLFLLIFIPIDDRSKYGRMLARYYCLCSILHNMFSFYSSLFCFSFAKVHM